LTFYLKLPEGVATGGTLLLDNPSVRGDRALTGTGRIEAFSDGVIAIIVTIVVLELRLPTEGSVGP
jgi:hypothetical protein